MASAPIMPPDAAIGSLKAAAAPPPYAAPPAPPWLMYIASVIPSLFMSPNEAWYPAAPGMGPPLGGHEAGGFETTLNTGIVLVTIVVLGSQRILTWVSYTVRWILSKTTLDLLTGCLYFSVRNFCTGTGTV